VTLGDRFPKRPELPDPENTDKTTLRNDRNYSPKDNTSHQNSAGMRRCVAGLVGRPSTAFRRNSGASSSEVQSKTLNTFRETKRHFPEDPNLQMHGSGNLKYQKTHTILIIKLFKTKSFKMYKQR
jgi:hypothetical protein